MKKIYLIPIIPFVLGIACFVAFAIIGSYVAPDGTLIEPFALVPIGYLLLAIGILCSIILAICSLVRRKTK